MPARLSTVSSKSSSLVATTIGSHRDGRHVEELLVLLLQLVAQRGNGATGRPHLAQQRQRNRAVRLHHQLARNSLINRLNRPFGRVRRRAVVGGQRLDANPVADLQFVRPRQLLARSPIVDRHQVAFAKPILRHVRRAGMPHVFTLRELLPGNHSAGVPADLAAPSACRAVDAPNRIRRRRTQRLSPCFVVVDRDRRRLAMKMAAAATHRRRI